ncbi:uncharacterized protein KQ657_002405 [Scheffersomyces spartinae]|uniref:Dilute domain-containing protein n=1 Tax=Scheffersomyces spartinae TaxID=45513 RepID=A0A9P7V691_9ASCO|nr:uncharacterized protein KQ657_002405 [Scheffersomyces spartinae]KAG7192048.1 hypothetical protein KQ657_002405 [Scheffersomyces spartinae]
MEHWARAATAVGGFGTDAGVDTGILLFSDPMLGQILGSKKALQLILPSANDQIRPIVDLLIACCEGDIVTVENRLRSAPSDVNLLYPKGSSGVTPLIYAICFDHVHLADTLLTKFNADPDTFDTIVHYTPLMWAVYLNRLEVVKLLLSVQADPYMAPSKGGKNAVDLVSPASPEIYEYFASHNIFPKGHEDDEDGETAAVAADDGVDAVAGNFLKLEVDDANRSLEEQLDEEFLMKDPILQRLPEFDYEKLVHDEFIKFSEADIPELLDYIFGIRTTNLSYQHETKLPAAIVFQLIRYAHMKLESQELTNFVFECFTGRLRSVTNTKSGAMNMAVGSSEVVNGDIVLLSYWLSVVEFLHFYFTKSELYLKYPTFLQDLINIAQSIIATLSLSINSRLVDLVDDCILNFTSLVEVSTVVYAKDWNLFGKKPKSHPSTYEDIFNMLYPPSITDLMKPSPIKYIQVLGALDYVLKIHQVDNLLRFQTFLQVFYYLNAVIFNKLLSQSKYCTRSKAIQIRLNISALEDWLRSHNYKLYQPDRIGGLNLLLGNEGEGVQLHNILNENDDEENMKNPNTLIFFYSSLYQICHTQLQPTIELLQWLQCFSQLDNEESLVSTIRQLEKLNYYQLFKVVNKLYKYEVGEPKMPKKIINIIKSLMNEHGEKQVSAIPLHYMTQSTFLNKEIYIYLNPNFIFNVALPNKNELITTYGAGLGGVKVYRSKKFQPSLPLPIIDDIDELIREGDESRGNERSYRENREEEDEEEHTEEEEEEEEEDDNEEDENREHNEDKYMGDYLFKKVEMPDSLAHKTWGNDDIESNPW